MVCVVIIMIIIFIIIIIIIIIVNKNSGKLNPRELAPFNFCQIKSFKSLIF